MIDHRNIESSGNLILQTQLLPFSSTIYKQYNMYKSLIQYETDYGYVFPNVLTQLFFRQSSLEISVDLSVQTGVAKFGQITIMLNKEKIMYMRRFTKIQEVIASIGGFLSAILFVASLLVRFITKRIFLIKLANDSYVHKSKDHKKRISMNAKQFTKRNTTLLFNNENANEVISRRAVAPTTKLKPNKKDKYKMEKKKFDFYISTDKSGKIKINLENILWPNRAICKLYEIMEKKCGIDELMMYCSQVEKMKKYLFASEEELDIFNNLPDLDLMEIFPRRKKFGDYASRIAKLAETNPDAKILEVIEKI